MARLWEMLFGFDTFKWVVRMLRGSRPLAWPSGWGWAVFAPAVLLALVGGVVTAVVSTPLWLPLVLIALFLLSLFLRFLTPDGCA